MKAWATSLSLSLAVVLAGCDAIGDGNALERLDLVSTRTVWGADRQADYFVAYECLPLAVTLVGTFSNGRSAAFTSRARWRSSNPAVAQVANGDDLVNPANTAGLNYAAGVVVPKSIGSTTITAEFAGLSTSMEVRVRPLDNVRIDAPGSTLARGSIGLFRLLADTDGTEENITSTALWSLPSGSNPNGSNPEAIVGPNSGAVTAQLQTGAPLTLTASLPECGISRTVDFNVKDRHDPTSNPDGFTLHLQDEFDTTADLITGTSELFTVLADFGNGPEQDVTSLVTLHAKVPGNNPDCDPDNNDANDPGSTLAAFGSPVNRLTAGTSAGAVEVIGCYNIVQRKADGTLDLDADGRQQIEARVETPVVTVNLVEGMLTDFSFSPDDGLQQIESLGELQFTATGQFTTAAGTVQQPITRHVAIGVVDDDSTDDDNEGPDAAGVSVTTPGLLISTRQETNVSGTPVTVDFAALVTNLSTGEQETLQKRTRFTVLPVACSDGIDNDGDGPIDFAEVIGDGDPGCTTAADNDERDDVPGPRPVVSP